MGLSSLVCSNTKSQLLKHIFKQLKAKLIFIEKFRKNILIKMIKQGSEWFKVIMVERSFGYLGAFVLVLLLVGVNVIVVAFKTDHINMMDQPTDNTHKHDGSVLMIMLNEKTPMVNSNYRAM